MADRYRRLAGCSHSVPLSAATQHMGFTATGCQLSRTPVSFTYCLCFQCKLVALLLDASDVQICTGQCLTLQLSPRLAFFERLRLLPSVQSAYRSNHSTETAVLKVITDVLGAADRGEISLLYILDLSAAFDTVDDDMLIGRLKQSFATNGLALSWIESFLRNRTVTE